MVVREATNTPSFLPNSIGLFTPKAMLSHKAMAVCTIALLTLTQAPSAEAILPGAAPTAFAISGLLSLPVIGGILLCAGIVLVVRATNDKEPLPDNSDIREKYGVDLNKLDPCQDVTACL